LLTQLARLEGEHEYRPVVSAAYVWGFDKHYGSNWYGDQGIRHSLIESAKAANTSGHQVLASELISFVKGKEFADRAGWYMHDLRTIVMALLANPACGSDANALADLYDQINEARH